MVSDNISGHFDCEANSRLIFATCSLSSMSLSPWSPLIFLLVGLMGGGPVLWLEMEEEDDEDEDEEEEDEEEEDRDRDWSLGSPLKAASPEKKRREKIKEICLGFSGEWVCLENNTAQARCNYGRVECNIPTKIAVDG
ncbi:hypothetical protein EYF80_007507 [Liparis tanakae]|uniref:Uncharacterized protein n=1 Tax=Liparis tanakae TaxID=230148 RepID=A0A4Z2IVW2_9TELE|nr:hypothetical protein EYF80_007507 [Liparis tanakae]